MGSVVIERLRLVHDPWLIGLGGLIAGLAGGFLLLPGDLVAKARIALHGLCAQRLSHTFMLGGAPLPFDARMTGIYLGVLIAAVPLLLTRRRGVGLSWPWLALLLAFVVAMGMDGVNSLRVDIGLPAWWLPDNRLRLGTGMLAGLSLGVALVWLLNLAGGGATSRSLLRARDGLIWLLGIAVAAVVVLSGAGWALAPVTLLLVFGAVVALTMLNFSVVGTMTPGLMSRRGMMMGGGRRGRGLAKPVMVALVLAVIEMEALAAFRFALEAMLGRTPA